MLCLKGRSFGVCRACHRLINTDCADLHEACRFKTYTQMLCEFRPVH